MEKLVPILLLLILFVLGCTNQVQNIGVQPNQNSDTGPTDDNGYVTLNIAGKDTTFQFIDELTGEPVGALAVGLAIDSETRSQGAMIVVDPLNKYPLYNILVQSGEVDSGISFKDLSSSDDFDVYKILLPKGPTTSMGKVIIKGLPSIVAKVTGFMDAAMLAAKALDSSGLQLGKYANQLGVAERRTLTQDEALTEIKEDAKNKVKNRLLFFVQPNVLIKGKIELPNPISIMMDIANLALDESSVMACGPSTGSNRISVTTIGPLKLYGCETLDIRQQTSGLVRAAVSGIDEFGAPLGKGSLELFSKSNIGLGFQKALNPGGSAQVLVPIGQYQVKIKSDGFKSRTEDIIADESGTSINVDLESIIKYIEDEKTSEPDLDIPSGDTTSEPIPDIGDGEQTDSTTEPTSQTEVLSVSVSGSCTVRERFSWGTPISFTVALSGSASGTVGAVLNLRFTDISQDCGAWGDNCKRDEGEPESTSWITQGNGAVGLEGDIQISVCDAGCAQNSVYISCPAE